MAIPKRLFFDVATKNLKVIAPRYVHRLAALSPLFTQLPLEKAEIAEIGPGKGDVLFAMRTLFPQCQFTAFEISKEAFISLAQQVQIDHHVTLLNADFTHTKDSAKFDLIMAFDVLEHIENDEDMLQAAANKLGEEGRLVLSVPCHSHRFGYSDQWAGHWRRYDRQGLIDKITAAGFEIEEFIAYGFPLIRITEIFTQFYYKRSLKRTIDISRSAQTQKSGIDRVNLTTTISAIQLFFLKPFLFIQYLFRNFDIGDGYIVVARKSGATVNHKT